MDDSKFDADLAAIIARRDAYRAACTMPIELYGGEFDGKIVKLHPDAPEVRMHVGSFVHDTIRYFHYVRTDRVTERGLPIFAFEITMGRRP